MAKKKTRTHAGEKKAVEKTKSKAAAVVADPKRLFDNLVKIRPGSFMMGISENDAIVFGEEAEQVKTRITKPFEIGRTVVTQWQWACVMGTTPWMGKLKAGECGEDFPAVFVSWKDASLFCKKFTDLGRDAGRLTATQVYRLPTEAEWEYACRAGSQTFYSFGDDLSLVGLGSGPKKLDAYGWYRDNSSGAIHEVARKKPNPWGLFDMHGNVWEWCENWYGSLSGGDDPVGPPTGSLRVLRGGACDETADECGCAWVNSSSPASRCGE